MIVLPVDLLYDRKKTSEPPVPNCCTLRAQGSVAYGIGNFPQFSRNFSQLDSTPPH